MNVFAYCDKRYVEATYQTVGWTADVITSPPVFVSSFQPEWLEEADFIYIDLHGQIGSVYLYSGPQQQWAALSLEAVRQAKLQNGPTVFFTTCYLPQTQFVTAFLEAGAKVVIGGDGENFGGKRRISGAQVLAQCYIQAMIETPDAPAETLLERAKSRFGKQVLQVFLNPTDTKDALEFKLWK